MRLKDITTITSGRRSIRSHLYAILPASLMALAGCHQPPFVETRPVVGQRTSPTVITQAEIRNAVAANTFELVQSLRPLWLNKRGPQTDVRLASAPKEGDVVVYLELAKLGGLEALREIAPTSLVSVEFLDPAKANYRFGRGHPYGAIVLSTGSK